MIKIKTVAIDDGDMAPKNFLQCPKCGQFEWFYSFALAKCTKCNTYIHRNSYLLLFNKSDRIEYHNLRG